MAPLVPKANKVVRSASLAEQGMFRYGVSLVRIVDEVCQQAPKLAWGMNGIRTRAGVFRGQPAP